MNEVYYRRLFSLSFSSVYLGHLISMRTLPVSLLFFLFSLSAIAQTGTLKQQLAGSETAGLNVELVWDLSCPNVHVSMSIQGDDFSQTIRMLPQLNSRQLYSYRQGQDSYTIESVEQIPGEVSAIQRIEPLGEEVMMGKLCQKFRVVMESEVMMLWVWDEGKSDYYGHLAPYFPSSREFQALAQGKWPGIVWQSEVRDLSGNLISSLKTIDFQPTKPDADRFLLPKDLRPVYPRKP
jgi:hypothetical protein